MLIHIGKCAGSNIYYKFKDIYGINISDPRDGLGGYSVPVYHGRVPTREGAIHADHICLLIRDPITRFISIYYHYYKLFQLHTSGEKIPHLETVKKLKPIFFKFNTANKLAESLSSEILSEKKLATSAFESFPHLRFNYEYYLPDSIILSIKEKKKKFIIRQEFYEEDFKPYHDFLIDKYKIKKSEFSYFIKNPRHSTDMYNNQKKLSKKAVDNLKNIMKNDYKVLNNLLSAGLITKEYINNFIK